MSNAPGEIRLEPEMFWHQCLLVVILVAAACVRFYSLDYSSLTAIELDNLAACGAHGWLDMASQYRDHTGMPPLYPTLLCEVADLFGNEDFFVRTLSTLAGLASIYILYITGRDFLSPNAGLLAAAAIAINVKAIVFSREASYVSLLTLMFLAHGYCFCRLFFFRDPNNNTNRPLIFKFVGTHSQLQWIWHPNLPYDARFLVGFWITGILMFYTSNVSLILLTAEFLASAFLLNQWINPEFNRAKLLRCFWTPLLIGALPWIYILYGYHQWVLDGNLFRVSSASSLWQNLRNFIPNEPAIHNALFLLILIFVFWFIAIKLFYKETLLQERFITYVLFLVGVTLLSLELVLTNDYSSHLYFWWSFILVLMMPIAFVINLIPHNKLKPYTLSAILLFMVIAQIKINAQNKLYQRDQSSDFRLIAKIIHDDKDFMASSKTIYSSSYLFNHYLEAYGITTNNIIQIDRNNPPANSASNNKNTDFYYLEHIPYDKDPQDTPTAQALSSQYKTLCVTKIKKVHAFKFSRDTSVTSDPNQDCRHYLSDQVSLK